jgi:hypothetical protein
VREETRYREAGGGRHIPDRGRAIAKRVASGSAGGKFDKSAPWYMNYRPGIITKEGHDNWDVEEFVPCHAPRRKMGYGGGGGSHGGGGGRRGGAL